MNYKYFSVEEIQKKLEYYCSYQERCHSEVFNKIMKLTTNIEDANSIITKLIDDGYLNETRFCKEFSIGKFNHKNWGKNRIISELKKRKISNKNIEIGLNEIDEDIYLKNLMNCLKNNSINIIGKMMFIRKRKFLISFLTGDGRKI